MREFLLIRHAPVLSQGRLIGRTDSAAVLPVAPPLQAGLDLLNTADLRICSPALRCRQTAAWLGGEWQTNNNLWEQDFGEWEGRSYDALPDLGVRSRDELAAQAAPEGESFFDVCKRYAAFLDALPDCRNVAVVAHSGIIRAAIGIALDATASGLGFNVAPLSLTRLTQTDAGWAINGVNLDMLAPKP